MSKGNNFFTSSGFNIFDQYIAHSIVHFQSLIRDHFQVNGKSVCETLCIGPSWLNYFRFFRNISKCRPISNGTLRVSPSDKKIEFLGPNGGVGEKKSIGTNIVTQTLPVWQTELFQFWKISFSEIVIMTRLPLQSRFQFKLKLCANV